MVEEGSRLPRLNWCHLYQRPEFRMIEVVNFKAADATMFADLIDLRQRNQPLSADPHPLCGGVTVCYLHCVTHRPTVPIAARATEGHAPAPDQPKDLSRGYVD